MSYGNRYARGRRYAYETEEPSIFRPPFRQDSACSQAECGVPYPPPEPGYSLPQRNGHRWYTPRRGDNLWSLSRHVLIRLMERKGNFNEPTDRDIATMSETIRSHPCNRHLRDVMFLPRFKRDRCTRGGAYYGVIYIPVVY